MIADVRFALRRLAKDRSFTVAALLTLALCIGGNTAIFSMLNALILRPLPFPEPERIVEVYNTYPLAGLPKASSNIPILVDYRENADAFTHLALAAGYSANIGEPGEVERIDGLAVTSGFFDVLGQFPEVGSFFTDEHEVQGAHRVAVLSHSYWRTQYDADPNVVGRMIELDEERFEILGVAPRAVEVLNPDARLFVAFAWDPQQVVNMPRHGNGPQLLGRLKPDTSVVTAKGQIDALDRAYYEAAPQIHDFLDRAGHVSQIGLLQQERVRDVESTLYLLQLGALFVLAIGCVNIANLLLVRSNTRQTEFAVRSALGAGPWDTTRQLVVESLVLAVGGGVIAAGLSVGGIWLINTYAMDMLPPMPPLTLDPNTLLFALALAVATGLVVAVFPVVHTLSQNLVGALNHAARGSSAGGASRWVSSTLVCGQVALALVLLVGAGLLMQSFTRILSRDLGFDPGPVTTLRISLSGPRYQEVEAVHAFQNRALEIVRALPGVDAAGLAMTVPMTTGLPYNTFSIRGYTMAEGEDQLAAYHTWVSPDYFETMGISLLAGEDFGPSDIVDGRRGIVIDQTLAERYYPGEDPIGRRLGFVGPNTPEEDWPQVIGVAEVAQHAPLEGVQGAPFMYETMFRGPFRTFSVFVKSSGGSAGLLPIIRERLREVDPYVSIFLSGALGDYVDDSLNNRRAVMFLPVIFAGIALLLSAIGIYGVMAYSVSQQTREIGTRAALGADRGQIMGLFLRRGLTKTIVGLALGVAGAVALSRFMTAMLYEVEATDPLVYASLTALLFAVSMLASYLPALRGTRIHPTEALRLE